MFNMYLTAQSAYIASLKICQYTVLPNSILFLGFKLTNFKPRAEYM